MILYTVKKEYYSEDKMTEKKYTVSILTLGCRVNQYESDTISAELEQSGIVMVPFGDECDVAIVNTCTVTGESDRKSRQMIRRAATFAGNIVVIGCYAQSEPEEAALMDKVRFVGGNCKKTKVSDVVKEILHGTYTGEKNNVTEPADKVGVETLLSKPMRTRSYIKIEDGCDNKCAYCLIHKARGPVRSKAVSDVIREVEDLSKTTHEIILTGIETASYGMDFDTRRPYGYALADLITEVNKIDMVKRIGLGSLEPTVMTDYFVSALSKTEKALPHFHLSIQSGSTKILNSMRRKYTADMALKAIERMKAAIPGVTFSCDVIVGFPGETEEDFLDTVEFCQKVSFLHLHIFPYSKRKGTEATEMPDQVPENIKHERAARLEAVGKDISNRLLEEYVRSHSSESKNPVYVLSEKALSGKTKGHSEHFIEVMIKKHTEVPGVIIPVYLESTDGKYCYGSVADTI